ncbi:GDSL-type esterase/lipase family protein [Corallococcus sp. bb12-1]|uniref:GDSL-type esterase/lipase family protein n=1 Tax=Corallococcus sp. bb12-1 TaxID=2996784 RepID=UPI00226EBF9C|nr:GDSL-type esterase/lipase family protein [Corallococcus sp. bb12-1]MCY1039943.1 GDSL-type esterase/lipase family protein [Corallococcus sp. bb12-1]
MSLKPTSTGWTLAFTVLLTVGLSLAPLPEKFRPLPSLRQEGSLGPKLVALALPASLRGVKAPRPPADTLAPDAPPSALADADSVGTDTDPKAGPEVGEAPAVPGIGLEELSAPTLATARELEALRERMGAKHVDIELNCRKSRADGTCEEDGLAPLMRALGDLRSDTRRTPVRVVHLGDSLIASDYITDVVRDRLQERFGSGGPGFLYIHRLASAGRATRAGTASTEGWKMERLVDTHWPKDRVGWTGVAFSTSGPAQSTRYSLEGTREAELYFLAQAASGSVQVSVDGKNTQRIQTRAFGPKSEAAFARLKLPEGAKTLTLTTSGKTELHGVALESGTPGVVYDTVGLLGGMAEVYLRAQPAAFRAQLRHRKPSLVVLMVGGNEAFFLSRERTTVDEVRTQMKELVSRVRTAVPDAACLVMSPIDAGVRTMSGELVTRRHSAEVTEVFREEARRGGCAFYDTLAAMGGEGSALKWLESGLMLEDLVHPRVRGSNLLGHLFDLSLQRAFARTHPPRLPGADPTGLQNATPALNRMFEALGRREAGAKLRVGIAQVGASHTAAHFFSDTVRAALTKRFGDAGRGFIAAGKPSSRLEAAHVSRTLDGPWTVEDAKGATPGGLWGLTGIRAVGVPGASLGISFCEGCEDRKDTPGRLDLYALDTPDAAPPVIRVDGEGIAPEAPPPEPLTKPTVRIRSFPVTGAAHTVQVTVPEGGGSATVLGASLEYDTPGLVYDALGLPGATAFTARDMDAAAMDEQFKARRPDLLVFWYGTNEAELPGLDAEALQQDYAALVTRLRKATGAECLLIGPTDRLQQDADGRWAEAPALGKVLATLPKVANDAGCAYWSARAAMGGERSMQRWQRQPEALGHADGVHLTQAGYTVLANAFVKDLMAAYESTKKGGEPTASAAGAP